MEEGKKLPPPAVVPPLQHDPEAIPPQVAPECRHVTIGVYCRRCGEVRK